MFTWTMITMQDSNSPIMDYLIFFHDFAMIFVITIMSLISYLFIYLIFNKMTNRNILHGHYIETIWTWGPMIILIFLAMPSLKILYLTDELFSPTLSIKSIGHQWYWSYEYSDLEFEFNSYMLNENKHKQIFRLLDTDNHLIVPFNVPIRILVTSTDVIHSWTIPSLGVKIDATPGRLNQIHILLMRPGVFYGQCSEICGANHSFMPIMMEISSMPNFLYWMKTTM